MMADRTKTSYVVQLFDKHNQRWLNGRTFDDVDAALAARGRDIEDFPDYEWRVVCHVYTLTAETVIEP